MVLVIIGGLTALCVSLIERHGTCFLALATRLSACVISVVGFFCFLLLVAFLGALALYFLESLFIFSDAVA